MDGRDDVPGVEESHRYQSSHGSQRLFGTLRIFLAVNACRQIGPRPRRGMLRRARASMVADTVDREGGIFESAMHPDDPASGGFHD
jgi:hypothetical protein